MIKEYFFNLTNLIPGGFYLQNKFVSSLLIIILFIFLAKIVLFVFEKYLKKIASKTKTEIDDLIFENTEKPLFYLILAYGLKLALLNLKINGVVSKIINSVMALVFLLIILKGIDVLITTWGHTFAKKTKTTIDDVILPLFHKIAKVIFVIIALMWILKIWEINITPYLAGVGISGLVLGFALQDSLKNIFGGISLILDKTFKVGDKIKIESGDLGEVHDIGLRSTKIRTYDNEILVIPNGQLANSRIQNYTKPNSKIRVGVDIGVEYGTDVKKVQKLVLETIKSMDEIIEDPAPTVNFLEMADFSLKFKAYFWVDDWRKSYSKKLEATEKIYNALNKAKINIPFPTQTVYLKK